MGSASESFQIVVAALIERGDRMLISQRRAGAGHAGRWEFPGGKREAGEDDVQALHRELREELGIELRVGEHAWTERSGSLELRFYWCPWAESLRPRGLEVVQFRWIRTEMLASYAFPPADSNLVQALVDGRLARPGQSVGALRVQSVLNTGGLNGEGKARAAQ
jgi:8-oxo-dGTP diphosphatase